MSFGRDASYSLFDALRPETGSEVTNAVVATYSLDLVALLGLVLALGGKADEEFETGPIGLVDAFRKMRGKLRVICQKGRIVVPRKHHAVLLLLDGMVRQNPSNERSASWHPKFAFVRYQNSEGPSWRLWIGSRNLTGSHDVEAGLVLTGKIGGARGAVLHDVVDLANYLLQTDDLPKAVLGELKDVKWSAPPGVKVNRIHWRKVGSVVPFLSKSTRPRPTIVISPFIDPTGIAEALAFAGGPIGLLTVDGSAKRVSFPADVDARIMGAPEALGKDTSEAPIESVDSDFQDLPPQSGLHAKLLLQKRGTKNVLLIGSANLTRRGLNGPNAEIMAELEISDAETAKSLTDFFDCRQKVVFDDKAEDNTDSMRASLDDDISSLISKDFRMDLKSSGLVLTADSSLDEFLARNSLHVGLLSLPSHQVEWPPGNASLLIYEEDLPFKSRTSLVVFEAVSKSDATVKRKWTQLIPFSNLNYEERDRAAIAAYVGPGRFKDWLRSAMEGVVPTESETWSGEPKIVGGTRSKGAIDSIFALEYVLGRWARNPDDFERRVPDVSSMLLAFSEEIERGADGHEKESARKDLAEVGIFWTAVSGAIEAGSE